MHNIFKMHNTFQTMHNTFQIIYNILNYAQYPKYLTFF
jgi:hypothetical protein